MDEKKIKAAFSKVKGDMDSLAKDLSLVNMKLESISGSVNLDPKTKKEIEKINKIDVEKIANNVEKDAQLISEYAKEFNDKIGETSKLSKDFSDRLEKYHKEILEVKDNMKQTENKSQENSNTDLSFMNERFNAFQEIITEKVDLELSSIRLEYTEEIAKLYDKLYNELDKIREEINIAKTKRLKEEEALQKEKEKLKKTIEEQKKKEEILSKKEKEKIEKTKKNKEVHIKSPEEPLEEKKEGKFKKAIKWLFVDEEDEDEMDSIKKEVDNKDKDKKKK